MYMYVCMYIYIYIYAYKLALVCWMIIIFTDLFDMVSNPLTEWPEFIGPWEMWLRSQITIFKYVSRIDALSISCEIAYGWKLQYPTDD